MIIDNRLYTQSTPPKQTLQRKFSHLAKIRIRKQDHSQLFPKTEVQTKGYPQPMMRKEYKQGQNSHSRSLDRQHERLPEVGRKATGKGNPYPMLLIKNKENGNSATMLSVSGKGQERGKAISDYRPKINKIKMKYLRGQNRSCQPNNQKSTIKHRIGYQAIVKRANENLRINFSCQRINPLINSQQLSGSSKGLRFKTEEAGSRGRYQQIPPEEFIYERQSSILGRGLVEKITKIMRKTRGELKL